VDLVVESEDQEPNEKLLIRFRGVTGLFVSNFGGEETRIIGLEVSDISDRGLENISFEIFDFENNQIHFYAREMEEIERVEL
jgi:hypothetical protein